MPSRAALCLAAAAAGGARSLVAALDNGAAPTPPMGFNSYMAPQALHNEAGLGVVADFLESSGLHAKGYTYVNTDEGWELPDRNAAGLLQWNPKTYPSGLPTFIEKKLHARGLKFGIYGAASGVTCGTDPGNLYHEVEDAKTYAGWGVDYVKSDNCATYALDASVRFAALRDALNDTGRAMLLSIEPFAITPDPAVSREVSNMWRVDCDIRGDFATFTNRADVSDKWAPLAGPNAWNDPDMINLQNPPSATGVPARPSPRSGVGSSTARGRGGPNGGFTLGENRMYFGLWALMKAPLILSTDLPHLLPELLDDVVGNEEVIAVNQDELGVQARKVQVGGAPLPWLVGLQDCAAARGATGRFYGRRWDVAAGGGVAGADTRVWALLPVAGEGNASAEETPALQHFQLFNNATARCLAVAPAVAPATGNRVVLLPCDAARPAGTWRFDVQASTVSSVSNVHTGQALAVSNATLYATVHGTDAFGVSDNAYGQGGLVLLDTPYVQDGCSSRDCQNYDPSQMWYYDRAHGLLRHSLYTASINHMPPGQGSGYTLTQKVPTFRHHCLAHVLSVGNFGTEANDTEVWAGPLAGGKFVVGLVNRGGANASIAADLSLLAEGGVAASSVPASSSAAAATTFAVRDLWARQDAGTATGVLTAAVPSHDIKLYVLTPH